MDVAHIYNSVDPQISWTVYDSRDKFIGFCEPIPSIVDGVVFKGKIYVITDYAESLK